MDISTATDPRQNIGNGGTDDPNVGGTAWPTPPKKNGIFEYHSPR
jgi:hypothetical protein